MELPGITTTRYFDAALMKGAADPAKPDPLHRLQILGDPLLGDVAVQPVPPRQRLGVVRLSNFQGALGEGHTEDGLGEVTLAGVEHDKLIGQAKQCAEFQTHARAKAC